MQDSDLQGPRSATAPRLEDRTPYSKDHAACWGWQDAGVISARPRTISRTTATPDAMPHSVLPTVFDHCTPAIRGGNDDFHVPLLMYTAPLCDYKRRRWASFKRDVRDVLYIQDNCHALRHAPQCTSHSVRPLHSHNSGENDDFHDPLRMYTVPPCDYKRRRASFKGDVGNIAQSDHSIERNNQHH